MHFRVTLGSACIQFAPIVWCVSESADSCMYRKFSGHSQDAEWYADWDEAKAKQIVQACNPTCMESMTQNGSERVRDQSQTDRDWKVWRKVQTQVPMHTLSVVCVHERSCDILT